MPKKILIIEDEPDIRKTIEYNLAREGFEIYTAASLNEGKSILNDTFSLLLFCEKSLVLNMDRNPKNLIKDLLSIDRNITFNRI